MISAVFCVDMKGFLWNGGSRVQWTLLPKPLLQLVTQLAEFGDSSFDQVELVLQQLCDGAVWVWRVPQGGDAAADLAEAEAQTLRGPDVEHQLHHVRRVIAVTVGAALRCDQPTLLVKTQGVAADLAGLG